MSNSTSPVLIAIFSSPLVLGVVKYAYDAWKQWRSGPSHVLRKQGDVDASIATVARARDELEADNERLRVLLVEAEARHETERQRWLADQARYREDITRLEAQIIRERDSAAARYDALLNQVQHLRRANVRDVEEPQ